MLTNFNKINMPDISSILTSKKKSWSKTRIWIRIGINPGVLLPLLGWGDADNRGEVVERESDNLVEPGYEGVAGGCRHPSRHRLLLLRIRRIHLPRLLPLKVHRSPAGSCTKTVCNWYQQKTQCGLFFVWGFWKSRKSFTSKKIGKQVFTSTEVHNI